MVVPVPASDRARLIASGAVMAATEALDVSAWRVADLPDVGLSDAVPLRLRVSAPPAQTHRDHHAQRQPGGAPIR